MQVDVQDVGVLEFPDDATDDEIQKLLNETYPAPKKQPVLEPPSTLRTPVKQTPFTEQEFALADPEYGGVLSRRTTEAKPFSDLSRGIPSAVGVTPDQIVPSGKSISDSPLYQSARPFLGVPAMLMPKTAATVGSSVAKVGFGVGDYLSSPQGITELVGSMTPARLLVLGKWAYDMGHGAYTEASELGTLLAKENKTTEDWQKISDHTINSLAMGLGAGGVVKHGAGEVKSLAKRLNMPEGKIQVEDRGELLQEIQNREIAVRQAEAGSPFVRREPAPQLTLPEGVQGAPAAIPIPMGGPTQPLTINPRLGAPPTFDPSGLGRPILEVPPEIQTGFNEPVGPSPVRAVESTGGRAAQAVRVQGEAAQRLADWQKAVAEKISQEQQAPVHPDKPLTANQLRIMRESLEQQLLQGQIPGSRKSFLADAELWADQILNDVTGPQEFRSGVPFKYAGAVLVKGAAILERGVRDAAAWTAEMVREFGEDIRPYLGDIRNEADRLTAKQSVAEGSPKAAEARAEPTLESDKKLFDELGAQRSQMIKDGKYDTPEFKKLWQDMEDIKNRHGGMPPGQTSAAPKSPDAVEKWFDDAIEKVKFGSDWRSKTSMGVAQVPVWLTQEAATLALQSAKAVYKFAKHARPAIEAGLDSLRGLKGFNEAEATAWIRKQLESEPTGALRMSEEEPTVRERETTVYPTEGASVETRKSAERATTSPMVPEPVQERIRTAPESTYTQQSMKRVEETVGSMSDTDLSNVPRDSNLYTASKLEQANRLFKRGENDAGYNVFVELEKEGTRLGQLINQFKLLKGTRPEEIVRVINRTLNNEGKDPLNKTQEKSALEKSTKAKETDRTLDEATTEWEKNPTPENAAKAEKALLDSNAAALELQRFVGRYSPRSTAGIIKAVLQGNLLTPISQTANLIGNMMNVPFRAGTRTVATSLDILDNFLTGSPREISVSPVRGTAEAAKGLARGAAQIPDVLLRGSGDVIKGEHRTGLHPIEAWINQFSKNPEMPTTGGKLTLKDRVNLAIEGTFGVPAEAMLRGLGAGDVPFREAAKARAVAAELDLAGVPREKWGFAQKFPELFLGETALKRIHDSTLEAIFQRPSKLLNLFTGWLRGKGEWWDLLAATVAPYKLTPWNIISEILSYNPLIATGKVIRDASKGNRREAKINAGKLVVGTALTTAGWWLYKNQLMSPSLDQRDEEQKARILAGEVMPPNHINISGLNRAMEKFSKGQKPTPEDTAFRKGDETRDVFRAGGLAGSMFYMTANIGRQFEKSPETEGSEALGAILRQSFLEQARFGMNQSFLQGVEGLLSAVREGNADTYIQRWGNTVASIPMPNSLTVMSRASREYKPDLREDTFKSQMENIVRNRLGVAGLDDYLPLKRDLWGKPMRETPEGRNAIMYHFFDVFKGKQVTSDPVPLELYRLWRKTTDTRVIPSLPEKVVTVGGQQYPLTTAQQSRYAELVGQSRRKIVDAIVVNPEFHKLPDEKKIDLLDRVYRAGQQQGKVKFWQENSTALKPKPQRAGFQQPVLQP